MRSHARVVVIGGGVIDCSILYHLTKLGWRDVLLLERDELTSGSTWHAAAGLHGLHGLHENNNVSRLQYYTMRLYAELEAETGQSCGIHQPGSIYLATSAERRHQLKIQAAKARQFSVDFYEIGLDEAKRLHPLLDLSGVNCAMFEADGGYVDPSGVTQAYAAGARAGGAEIRRFTPVLETNPHADGGWDVVTPEGTVRAEILVNAAGLWGREVAALASVDLPLIPMEHQYFVAETILEIAALDRELPSIADLYGEYYLRQEAQGLLVGAYERDGRYWSVEGTPLDFGHELLPDDLERISENIMGACGRIPALAEAGIKRVINRPMIWAPDEAALLGPVPELRNYFCCNGIVAGFSQSGGLGTVLTQWIMEGEPELDLFPWDLARYGAWASKTFTMARALETYSSRFKIHFPHEERAAGRPVRTRPAYERQRELGAVFGLNTGWEQPLWYRREGDPETDDYGFERQPWFEVIGRECRALRAGVGIVDISAYAKYEASGAAAGRWLDGILTNRLPDEVGQSRLAPVLGRRGGIMGDFTVTRMAQDRWLVVGSGMAERYHSRIFRPAAGVDFVSRTEARAGFNIAGPRARERLARLTNADVSNAALPFGRGWAMEVAGLAADVLRVSFTGDLGYEIYVDEADQAALFDALLAAVADLGAVPVGARAVGALRVEKGYGSWGREYSPEYWLHEVGLDALVKVDKGDFLGREAYLDVRRNPPRELLSMLAVEAGAADAVGGEPLFDTDRVGRSAGSAPAPMASASRPRSHWP